MTRVFGFLLLATLVLGSRASAGMITAVDTIRYPADISLIVTPDITVANVANFFTQTNTPKPLDGLNLIMSTFAFPLPADQPSDIGPTFSGNPFGVYKSFSNQYQSFLGTYGDPDAPTGLVALLAPGVGLGKTFNEVFGDAYNESDVIGALVALRFGSTGGFLMLYEMMSGSLAKQPVYSAVGPDSYVLGPAELIKFSTRTSAGEFISGSYRIPGTTQPVPEPGSLILAVLGIGTILSVRWCRCRDR